MSIVAPEVIHEPFTYNQALQSYREKSKVALLRKTIYGLKQSVYQWNKNLFTKLLRVCLTRLLSDYSVFIRNPGTNKVVIVVVYVDDFLLFGLDMKKIESVKC